MGGGGSSAAPTFNSQQVSKDQTQSNVQMGIANSILGNVNQNTPYGSLTYEKTGTTRVGDNDVPSYTATQTLSPEQMSIMQRQNNLGIKALDVADPVLGNIYNTIQSPLNFNNARALNKNPAMGEYAGKVAAGAEGLDWQGPSDPTKLRNDAYEALMGRTRTDLDRSREGQQTQLANQGIAAGSEAWNRAMEGQDRALVDAAQQSTINAGNIASQDAGIAATLGGARSQMAGTRGNLFGQAANITGAEFGQDQALRNQDINEIQTLRNSPLQDYSTLMGFSGGPQSPNFVNTPQGQIPMTDVTSPAMAQYQGQMNQWQQGQANNQSTMGGLFGLGGSILGGAARALPWGKMFGF